jgi:hypothetical protein
MLARKAVFDKRALRRLARQTAAGWRFLLVDTAAVICPSCFQEFEVPAPAPHETPCDVDYDCEICCRPMRIVFEFDGDEVYGSARGLDD